MALPLRLQLRYDPVFLEFSRRMASGEWGKLGGVSVQAAAASPEAARELLAFLFLLLGPWESSFSVSQDGLSQYVLCYGTRFAVQLLFVPTPTGLESAPVAAASALESGGAEAGPLALLSGTASFRSGLAEFRWGSERLLAFAPSEDEWYRIALPEGEGERYSAADSASAKPLATAAMDAAALAEADRLIAERRAAERREVWPADPGPETGGTQPDRGTLP